VHEIAQWPLQEQEKHQRQAKPLCGCGNQGDQAIEALHRRADRVRMRERQTVIAAAATACR
jgi:hypothetical protein